MLELLNMAKKALVDKDDQYFKFCTVDLEMILDWSSTRHWNSGLVIHKALELPVAGDTRCDTYGGLPFLESGPETGKRGEQAGEGRSSGGLGGN